jgi:hypothetical protein
MENFGLAESNSIPEKLQIDLYMFCSLVLNWI